MQGETAGGGDNTALIGEFSVGDLDSQGESRLKPRSKSTHEGLQLTSRIKIEVVARKMGKDQNATGKSVIATGKNVLSNPQLIRTNLSGNRKRYTAKGPSKPLSNGKERQWVQRGKHLSVTPSVCRSSHRCLRSTGTTPDLPNRIPIQTRSGAVSKWGLSPPSVFS